MFKGLICFAGAPPLSGQQALTVDEQSIHISWDANPYLPGDYVMLYYQVLTLTDAVNDIVSVNVSANVSEYLVEGLESASVYVFVVVQWFSGQEGDVDNDGRFNSTSKCERDDIIMLIWVPSKHKTMLAQRRRRWANVVQMLYKCFVFTGIYVCNIPHSSLRLILLHVITIYIIW